MMNERGHLLLLHPRSSNSYNPILLFSCLFVFLLSFSCEIVRAGKTEKKNVYVVYMGAASPPSTNSLINPRQHQEDGQSYHLQLLASVLNSRNKEEGYVAEKRVLLRSYRHGFSGLLLRSYRHGFSGFAARLSKKEAQTISKRAGVVSVFVDPVLQLHTTRSWDFLQYQTDLEIDNSSDHLKKTTPHETGSGTDTIIGILDTGIWPESESFKDKDMGPIPSHWKGVCMQGHDFLASNCNRKLIGARYYNDSESDSSESTPRDTIGHGTHTASTAAGSPVTGASYYNDLAAGTAKGGSPGSRIAVYRVCTSNGCRGSSILAAFDDAIGDGVDVLSLSLGASAFNRPDFSVDPIAIGAFHAFQKGITVVCSAGNDGPSSSTVVNVAPWILTVAATTIDRDFESDVVLGGSDGGSKTVVVKGEAINFSTLRNSPIYPIIYAGSAKSSSSSANDARNCNPDSLDGKKIKGNIVLCDHTDQSYSKKEKMEGVKEIGGIGLVLIDDLERQVAFTYGAFPLTVVSSSEASQILSYLNSTRNPVATILPTVAVTKYKPAPTVAYFSSRGPSLQTRNLLKPDVAAPGVNILAAWMGTNDTSEVPDGQKPSQFNLLSGTSMACPHVSGIAATIKSRNPSWSSSAIRSAIMTTATQSNNEKALLTTDSGETATPYDYGAGEVSPSGALQPGLVYEANTDDYLQFLCNYGYRVSDIKLISSNVPDGFDCPKNSSKDLVSELNYPSIAISKFTGKESRKVGRTVTNVGAEDETIYTATVNTPRELDVKVIPSKLEFTKSSKKLMYEVIFSAMASSSSPSSSSITSGGDIFGSITWSNGKHKVRTPFVVTRS